MPHPYTKAVHRYDARGMALLAYNSLVSLRDETSVPTHREGLAILRNEAARRGCADDYRQHLEAYCARWPEHGLKADDAF